MRSPILPQATPGRSHAAPVPAAGSASLRLPKRANWPVLACPRARGVVLPPAGALYPLDLDSDGESLRLSWEHGPAAQVLQELARQGVDVSRLNGERLLEQMLALSAGDPGGLDLDHLASRLASGEFRVTDLRLRPTRELCLELPPGTWFLDSPFRPAQELEPGQELLLAAVPWGRYHLFAVQLPGGFDLFVGERKALLVPLPGD